MRQSFHFARQAMKMIGSRRGTLDVAHGRLVLVSAFFALVYILIMARVVDLSLIQGEWARYAAAGDGRAAAPVSAVAPVIRSDITDRNGVLLATSLETASLYADPALIHDPAATAKALVEIFPSLSYGEVLQKLQRRGRFIWLYRNLTPDEQYAVLNIGEPGLNFKTEYRRIYPQGQLAAHMVGFTDVDGNGLAGVERSFDNLLKAGGPEPVSLTLDIRLQHILRRETKKAMDTFGGKAAAGVVMDVENGEILAAVSLPDFDPHNPGAGGKNALFNRLTLGTYELGSTFKIFSTAALLDTRNVGMGQTFDAREPIKRGRFTISDYHAEKRILTVPEIFMYSSNIGAALMGDMVGTDRLKDFYRDLGLLTPLSLEIDEIGKPQIPDPWREINTLTASFGHGIAVTPLQMVGAAATIMGGGTRIQPTLIYNGDKAKDDGVRTDIRVVSPQTAHRMRQLMRLVVTDGTGTHADVPGYRVGGKTGTAEKPGVKGYDSKRLISSFMGFFPMDEPRYAVFVMVDEPKGVKETFGYATGGWVAAPAVGHVIAAMGPLLGMKPAQTDTEDALSASLKQYVHFQEGHHAAR
ncbi:MAG: penicillin-binding protein 2 [Rhodospirillales bacterium]|nr:penicillin-binding protein 2 [Rhodospirillales bacterium]